MRPPSIPSYVHLEYVPEEKSAREEEAATAYAWRPQPGLPGRHWPSVGRFRAGQTRWRATRRLL